LYVYFPFTDILTIVVPSVCVFIIILVILIVLILKYKR